MKTVWTLLLAMCILPAVSFADGPATAPSAPMVMFVPLQQGGAPETHGWMGEAIQENLMTLVQREGYRIQVADRAVTDRPDALAQATAQGSNKVVLGTYWAVNDQLGVNAEVDDVATGKIMGVMLAKGTVRDLFAIDDSLDAQMEKILIPLTATPPLVVAPPAEQPAYAPGADVTPYDDSDYGYVPDYGYTYSYPNYDYGDEYPYYDYGYGGY